MTPEQAGELVELAQPALLAEVREHLSTHGPLRTRAWLDGRFSAPASLALLDCAATQLHFTDKFEQSRNWLLTREAAEQATPSVIASWRAEYLRVRFPNFRGLVELGTGIGGDSVYLARHFEVTGYERDPARVALARANVARSSPRGELQLIEGEVVVEELRGELLFADPARREHGRKFDPEDWSPPLSRLLSADFAGLVLKTAPGLDLARVPQDMEIHFLSLRGELKEAMLLGGCKGEATRHAWLWTSSGEPCHRCGQPGEVRVREPGAGDYLHDPDPALTRSGLLGGLALELEAGVVHPKIGYLTGPRPCQNAWASSFRVLDAQPLNWKRLGQALLATDWSEFEYLSRGVPFSQDEVMRRTLAVRKRMKGRPGGRGALIVYRDAHGYRVLLASRVRDATETLS